MIFRQLFEPETFTYTYLLGCEATKKAVLIDTVASEAERCVRLLEELGADLNLPYPRFIDQALPANQSCVRPNDADQHLRQG
jgi:hypothetical protein